VVGSTKAWFDKVSEGIPGTRAIDSLRKGGNHGAKLTSSFLDEAEKLRKAANMDTKFPVQRGNLVLVTRASQYKDHKFFQVGAGKLVVTCTAAQVRQAADHGLSAGTATFLEVGESFPLHLSIPDQDLQTAVTFLRQAAGLLKGSDFEAQVGRWLDEKFPVSTKGADCNRSAAPGLRIPPEGAPTGTVKNVGALIELVETGVESCSALLEFDSEEEAPRERARAAMKVAWGMAKYEARWTEVKKAFAM